MATARAKDLYLNDDEDAGAEYSGNEPVSGCCLELQAPNHGHLWYATKEQVILVCDQGYHIRKNATLTTQVLQCQEGQCGKYMQECIANEVPANNQPMDTNGVVMAVGLGSAGAAFVVTIVLMVFIVTVYIRRRQRRKRQLNATRVQNGHVESNIYDDIQDSDIPLQNLAQFKTQV